MFWSLTLLVRSKRLTLPVILLLVGLLLIGGSTPAMSQATLQITATPGLFPAFDPSITDYVVPASGTNTSVSLSINAPRNVKVAVDGQPFKKLAFTATVNNVAEGQRFSFVVNDINGSKTYNVRRIPSDFPTWTVERTGTPQAEFFVFTPDLPAAAGNFAIIADNHGVPLWWLRPTFRLLDVDVLSNGDVAWMSWGSPFIGHEFSLTGSLVRTFQPDPGIGGQMDGHEIQRLSNGDFIYIVNVNRSPVDLSAFGGSSTATVIDNVIEEVAPDGTLVWSWSSFDHLPIDATADHWRTQYLVQSVPTDPYHMNSVDEDGDGFIVSFRHHDAVYRIDKATGAVTWKLGGSTIPESLTFVGDAIGNLSGQHDARMNPDGTLTIHDNGSGMGRLPRGVRYSLDLVNRTATLLEQIVDPEAPTSPFIGSARRLPGGDWVTNFGANSFFAEYAPNGTSVFKLRFNSAIYSYRSIPIPFGKLLRADLVSGMDVQYPR